MNYEEIARQIRCLIDTEPERSWKAHEIGDVLGFRGHRTKTLKSILNGMVEDGTLAQVRPGCYAPCKSADLLTGTLELVRSGAGYVTDKDTGEALRIPQEDVGIALPGDIVIARKTNGADSAASGKIIKIVTRGSRSVVGTFTTTGRLCYVVPIDPVYHKDIAVAESRGANEGDRVVVRLIAWESSQMSPKGEIIEVIGPADKPSLDTEVICRQYDLPGDFPDEVIVEASAASVNPKDNAEREDLRNEMIITVDPASARDFDDAVSFKIEGNVRVLGVHIADVSAFVKPGTRLDAEAADRSTTVYLADKVIPMLPECLSNGLCSLRPDEDRLAVSVFLTFNRAGRLISRRFARSVIRSKVRLNYGQALALIEDRTPEEPVKFQKETAETLKECARLAAQLRAIRMKSGALDIDAPECEIILDGESRMTGIAVRENDIAHQMIEECMVAANEAVAQELASKGRTVISRLHEAPDPLKIEELSANLKICGFTPGDISNPSNLAHFMASIAEHPLKEHAHTLILRSMKRAIYSADATGHFGLAKHFYSHFTSPIRRYPDLILHRQLCEILASPAPKNSVSKQYLKTMATHCTEREERADEASRALIEIKKYRFLQQQIDDNAEIEYDAVISKVTNFGLFVDVNAIQTGGLIRISAISNNFVRYDKNAESLSANGKSYKIGNSLKVKVVKADFIQKHIDFVIVNNKNTNEKRTVKTKTDRTKTAKNSVNEKSRATQKPRTKATNANAKQGGKRRG